MKFHHNVRNECIAFALATGMAEFESTAAIDRDCERATRRQRYLRKKGR